jgi:hypothetical protein
VTAKLTTYRLRPRARAKRLAPFFTLANIHLPEADRFERVPEPLPLSEVIRGKQSERVQHEVSDPREVRDRYVETTFDAFVKCSSATRREIKILSNGSQMGAREGSGIGPVMRIAVLRIPENPFFVAANDPAAKRELYELRLALRNVLDYVASVEKFDRVLLPSRCVFTFDLVRISPEGAVDLSRHTPWEYFRETLHGAEAQRIRVCPICDGYFYAWRKNSPACTRRCVNAYNQRLYRDRLSVGKSSKSRRSRRQRKKQNRRSVEKA